MNGLNNSGDDVVECPLCMEPLEVDDLNFFPCTCGYQICRFCWHRIRTDENELCPACRKEYPENPADFTPLTQEEILAFKSQKRQRDQQRKQKITENRKHLSNVRVVQKNLVFVVGLPPRLADAEILKKHEYFGKYGKIHKVVINPSTTYAGVQGPSASAYVTYVHNTDALRAIQSVNNVMIDGRLIKTSLGTTKYCSHFMKNQQCPKGDCMYLHELGDPEASFTKEEMHQGKHQEYEKRLHDALIATSGTSSVGGIGHSNISACASALGSTTNAGNSMNNSKNSDKTVTYTNNPTTSSSATSSSILSSSSVAAGVVSVASTAAVALAEGGRQKEAWPSLSVSPVNTKEPVSNSKNKKEKMKPEKSKNEKSSRTKNKNSSGHNSNNNNNASTINKENNLHDNVLKEGSATRRTPVFITSEPNSPNVNLTGNGGKLKSDKLKEKLSNRSNEEQPVSKDKPTISADEEVKLIEGLEKPNIGSKENTVNDTNINVIPLNKGHYSQSGVCKNEDQRSFSSNSNRSGSSNNSNVSINNSDLLSLSESTSGKSSPGSFAECNLSSEKLTMKCKVENDSLSGRDDGSSQQSHHFDKNIETNNNGICEIPHNNRDDIHNDIKFCNIKGNNSGCSEEIVSKSKLTFSNSTDSSNVHDSRVALSNMDSFGDNNSFFSSATPFQQSLNAKNKGINEIRNNQADNAISPHLPDLLKGIDGYQNNAVSNEFPNLSSHFHGNKELNRLPQTILLQQQQQQTLQQIGHSPEHLMSNNLFDANMSRFFDFHKNQQQQMQQQFLINGHSAVPGNNSLADHLRVVSLLENNRINSQFLEQSHAQQQQIQKQRTLGQFDSMLALQQHHQQSQNPQHTLQQQQVRLPGQFSQNAFVDDDLGFDPFIETQKGLAELMENEVAHHQNVNVNRNDSTTIATKILQHQQQQSILENIQRTRMPPPGFNHMNAFGFGLPRTQNNSKIFSFANMAGNSVTTGAQSQQQNMQVTNSWNPHFGAYQTQQQTLTDTQTHQIGLNQSTGNHSKAYSNNDWTAMDPAILSFRQFSSIPQQSQIPHHPQHQDLFMQHLTQQQNGQNFTTQSQVHGGTNLSGGNILNSQSASQAQVNANVQGMLEYLKTRQFV